MPLGAFLMSRAGQSWLLSAFKGEFYESANRNK